MLRIVMFLSLLLMFTAEVNAKNVIVNTEFIVEPTDCLAIRGSDPVHIPNWSYKYSLNSTGDEFYPISGKLTVKKDGQLQREISVSYPQGNYSINFVKTIDWDGKGQNGEYLPEGDYVIHVSFVCAGRRTSSSGDPSGPSPYIYYVANSTPSSFNHRIENFRLGEQKALTILVNDKYQNEMHPDLLNGSMTSIVETMMGTVNDYYSEVSYGKTSMSHTVIDWSPYIPIPATGTIAEKEFFVRNQALYHAMQNGADLSEYRRIVFLHAARSTDYGNANWGGIGFYDNYGSINFFQSGKTYSVPSCRMYSFHDNGQYGDLSKRVGGLIHELGHGIMLHHAKSLWSVDGTTMTTYGNECDVMGTGGAHHFQSGYKHFLGWFDAGQVAQLDSESTSGTYVLEPYETVSPGLKAININLDKNYYFEYRTKFGFDSALDFNNFDSLHINYISTSNYVHGYCIDATPETYDKNLVDKTSRDSGLTPGRTYADYKNGLFITPRAPTAAGLPVVVNLLTPGEIANNQAPIISSINIQYEPQTDPAQMRVVCTPNVIDPDDANEDLAYYWIFTKGDYYGTHWKYDPIYFKYSFDDGDASYTYNDWVDNPDQRVILIVSDMKGGQSIYRVNLGTQVNTGVPVVQSISTESSHAQGTVDGLEPAAEKELLFYDWTFSRSLKFEKYKNETPLQTEFPITSDPLSITLNVTDGEYSSTLSVVRVISAVADAGDDQSLVAPSGVASVLLDGSGSTSNGGQITSYTWSEAGQVLGTGETLSVSLSAGVHIIRLEVLDDVTGSMPSDDYVTISIALSSGANAGSDQIVTDDDANGVESVVLNGLDSISSDQITLYQWFENGQIIAEGEIVTEDFSVGVHEVTLFVFGDLPPGYVTSDSVTITVMGPSAPAMESGEMKCRCESEVKRISKDPKEKSTSRGIDTRRRSRRGKESN